jgi:DNA-binding PadR family transcriptional regulator
MKEGYLGEFEQMVLLTTLGLGDEAYGMRIMDELERRVGREVSRGAMYITLDRMESKGLLTSRMADPTAERGGRGKRYVEVSPAGLEALQRSRAALAELWKGLDPILDGRS